MSNSLFAIMKLTAIDGKAHELALLLQQIVESSQREEGCLGYDLLMNEHDGSEFVFLEEWESKEAFDRHGKSSHIESVGRKWAGLVAEQSVTQLKRIA
jgi:quinol monooxygenase YgiN